MASACFSQQKKGNICKLLFLELPFATLVYGIECRAVDNAAKQGRYLALELGNRFVFPTWQRKKPRCG